MTPTSTAVPASPLRVPDRRHYGEAMSGMMHQLQLHARTGDADLDRQGWTGRRVLGFRLPGWQRPQRWTTEQCALFIRSVYLGVNIGAYMVNQSILEDALHDVLIDGQQRLHAIELYWADAFPLRGEDGRPWLWSDLAPAEQARFLRIPFPFMLTRYDSEERMKEAYDLHNFGGTPHEPHERALPAAAG